MFRIEAHGPQEICNAVYELVGENLAYFDTIKRAIDPLETPVKYRRETPGVNEFLNVRDLLDRGFGDCEDLAAWMVAYFLFLRYEARPVLIHVARHLWHVSTEVKFDGRWVQIDPSKLKGMK